MGINQKSFIPDSWSKSSLAKICEMKSGLGITSKFIAVDGLYPCFGGNGLRGFTDKYTHDGNYPLIGRQGALCGNIVFAKGKFFASEHAVVASPKKNISAKWLSYVLDRMNLNQYSESSAQPGLSVSKLLNLEIIHPCKYEEQEAIANALSDADAYIESLEKLIEKKRLIKKGVMQELLSGKIRLNNSKQKWGHVEASAFGDIVTGGTPSTTRSEFWNGEYPWITPTDISKTRDIYSSERSITSLGRSELRPLPANTLLVTCIASIGKNAILKTAGACNQQINAIIPNSQFDVVFLYYLFEFNKQFLLGNAGTTATAIISKQTLSSLKFKVPPIEEQRSIASLISDIDDDITTYEILLKKARFLKQGMMQELLTGRIRLV